MKGCIGSLPSVHIITQTPIRGSRVCIWKHNIEFWNVVYAAFVSEWAESIHKDKNAIWYESVITGNHNHSCSPWCEGNSITILSLVFGGGFLIGNGCSTAIRQKQIDFLMKFHFHFSHHYHPVPTTFCFLLSYTHAHRDTHAHTHG